MKANEIEVEFLEEMLVYLKEKYDVISLDEMCSRLKSKVKQKKKFIVITFDDGYKDNLTLAYPIFKKLNIPFTIYITNCYPNKTAKLWWYMLEDILLENENIQFTHNNKSYKFKAKKKYQKDVSFEEIRGVIINASTEKQAQLLAQLEKSYDKNLEDYVFREALSWNEINTLSKDPLVNIGCHTINHLALNTLTKDEQLKEVLGSKSEIDHKIDLISSHFAYPFGTSNEVNGTEINNIKSTRCIKTATTTRMGNIFYEHKNNLHALPRIQVLGTQQDLSILDLYLCGVLPALKNKFKKAITL
jgi:peptidoglycan/xylan/chitin deacetylase (PgdA/CDA1 family)